MTYQCSIQEVFGIALEFRYDVVLFAIIVLIEAQPDASKVELFDKALANVIPLSI